MSPPEPANDRQLLEALDQGVAWSDRSDRVRLDVTGPDRAKFLQNLTTNDVKRLTTGHGLEAFVTSLQGRTLGLVLLHAAGDRFLLRTDPGALSPLLPHFQKYGALDEVAWSDRSDETFEYHLVGPNSEELIRQLGGSLPPRGHYNHHATSLAGRPVLIVRESPLVDSGVTIIGEQADADTVSEAIREAGEPLGLAVMSPQQFEALRIEAGTPVSGRDLTDANLPQEVGRDARAISFVKGCYLGQETVARLDALGHVNKILRRLRFESETPPAAGTPLSADGKEVGRVTSAARSPRDGKAVGLAYVRVAQASVGTALTCVWNGVEVIARVAELPTR